jgi:hypothetical protein
MTAPTSTDAARWDAWQRANREATKRADVQARIAAGLMLVGVAAWLAIALAA